MANNVYVTLHNSMSPIKKSMPDIVRCLIQFAVADPGFISVGNEMESMNLRTLLARYGSDMVGLASAFENVLGGKINGYFPDQNLRTAVTFKRINDANDNKLIIDVTYPDGTEVLDIKDIHIENGKLVNY